MITQIQHKGAAYSIDLSRPIDISISLRAGEQNVNAWHVPPVRIEAVMTARFSGDVNQGGPVNFRNISFNPHGNGTHTECVGHISKEPYTVNQCLKQFFFLAELVSIAPKEINGDRIITAKQVSEALKETRPEAIVIRTLPNEKEKINRQYSDTNPPYLHKEAAKLIRDRSIDHLLIDLPSIDREEDAGVLAAHHAWWEYPENTQLHRTITELIYVPDAITDGPYMLNLQLASLENDASPSKPVLFSLIKS